MEVLFVGEPDPMTPIGTKGIGEIGIVGIAAAISNAVYHATGIRIRELPITPDKLVQ
jgi:xanthine dehydrogenase YagR molybdenum-binding subunit